MENKDKATRPTSCNVCNLTLNNLFIILYRSLRVSWIYKAGVLVQMGALVSVSEPVLSLVPGHAGDVVWLTGVLSQGWESSARNVMWVGTMTLILSKVVLFLLVSFSQDFLNRIIHVSLNMQCRSQIEVWEKNIETEPGSFMAEASRDTHCFNIVNWGMDLLIRPQRLGMLHDGSCVCVWQCVSE